MHAGLYDDSPRSRELVWIMLAQRAARGLGSLYAHANEMTMEEAGVVHMEWTPRGWMKTEKELLSICDSRVMEQATSPVSICSIAQWLNTRARRSCVASPLSCKSSSTN